MFARAAGAKPNNVVPVPFEGCRSFGMVTTLEAPRGTTKSVSLSPSEARMLTFYESGDGIGLLGPRGWYCEGASGSSGSVLFVSPKPIHRDQSGWHGLEGAAIELYHITSENSGRYEVANIILRVFPDQKAWAINTMTGVDSPIPSGPPPKDTLLYRSRRIVEYRTPPKPKVWEPSILG
jgi:hypothetical protein